MARKRKELPVLQDITITDVAAEGNAVARADGEMVIFIPFGAPGDVADIKLTKKKKSDMIVCFTKVRNKAFEKFLESTGVEVIENFNKNVKLLIVPNLSQTSSKIEKAYKWRIPIMEISEAYKKFGFVEE